MAGLLDNLLFNSPLYGGKDGGLLDFLRTTQMQQDNYQPSGGFAPTQQPTQPAQQPDQAQPISVGGYQMPRIGAASLFNPVNDPAALPTNSQPTSGQPNPMNAMAQMSPQGMVQPQVPQPDTSPSFFDRIGSFARPDSIIGRLFGNSSSNMTAKALLAKGVDPQTVQAAVANPELMKLIIAQTYGPKTVQSLGNGYVVQDGKISRAYEPDDKIPVGFQKTDKGLEPIPGGPSDPNYIRAKTALGQDPNAIHVLGRGGELYKTGPDGNPVIVHKNEAETAVLDDPTTSAMAAQYLAGDKSVMQNLGRGAQGAANVVKLRNEIYKQARAAGLDGRDIVENFNEQAGALAGQRAVGTRAANISLAANEANNMIPIALAASDKLPRSQYMPWNKMVQAVQKGSSSPELASFVAATNSLVNSYVRAVSPSGVPTDSMREHAYSMLNAAQGPEAYKAVIETMKQEMNAALSAPSQVKKELRHKPEDSAPSQPSTFGKTKNGVSWGIVQ